jgi:repressor LexA
MSPRSSSNLSSVGTLLRAMRERAEMTQESLARASGCSKAYLSLVESGQRTLSVERAVAIEAALDIHDGRLQAALNWQRVPAVIRAQVELSQSRSQAMARQLRAAIDSDDPLASLRQLIGDSEATAGSISDSSSPVLLLSPSFIRGEAASAGRIPIINKVAAGYPREFTDLDYPTHAPPHGQRHVVADDYLACPDVSDPDAFAARVVGDSMEPEYFEGDVVVFSPLAKIAPEGGADCFVRLERDAETTFKRVYFEQEGRTLRLQPLNSSYPPVMVQREDVAGLYAAVYVLRKVRRGV